MLVLRVKVHGVVLIFYLSGRLLWAVYYASMECFFFLFFLFLGEFWPLLAVICFFIGHYAGEFDWSLMERSFDGIVCLLSRFGCVLFRVFKLLEWRCYGILEWCCTFSSFKPAIQCLSHIFLSKNIVWLACFPVILENAWLLVLRIYLEIFRISFWKFSCPKLENPVVKCHVCRYLELFRGFDYCGGFTVQDVYLHTNCLAALANMAPHVHRLDAYASQRLVSLFHMLSRKYIFLLPPVPIILSGIGSSDVNFVWLFS